MRVGCRFINLVDDDDGLDAKFERLLEEPEFKAKYGTLAGDRNKIIAPEFREELVLPTKKFRSTSTLNLSAAGIGSNGTP